VNLAQQFITSVIMQFASKSKWKYFLYKDTSTFIFSSYSLHWSSFALG